MLQTCIDFWSNSFRLLNDTNASIYLTELHIEMTITDEFITEFNHGERERERERGGLDLASFEL